MRKALSGAVLIFKADAAQPLVFATEKNLADGTLDDPSPVAYSTGHVDAGAANTVGSP